MDIITFKTQFEKKVQPVAALPPVSVEQAWGYLKASLAEPPEQLACAELSFSASEASHYDGHKIFHDPNLFQIYFGWLLDANPGSAWHTLDINFYYRYAMTPQLRALLDSLPRQEIEVAYCLSEDAASIRQKIDTVLAFSDQLQEIWQAVQHVKPASASCNILWI